jgi:hypothetical protein
LFLLSWLAAASPSIGQAPRPAKATSVPRRLDATASFTMPFELVGGLILLRNLTFNGQRGSFILDTGSSYALVVDNTSFAKQLRAAPKSSGLGATGQVTQLQLPVASL